MGHPLGRHEDAAYVSAHFERLAMEAQHRHDAERGMVADVPERPKRRRVRYDDRGALCLTCNTMLADDGSCAPWCDKGM